MGDYMWTSKEVRSSYLKFFESKGHLIAPSDSLVPDDPSLLYTSAGMVQFKSYFMGEAKPPCGRISTSQKCMRTDDIEEVGDAVHHTFFEMLGNFSFGDYFKYEAITWAWEFLTEVLKINPENLWTSVYEDDSEAYDIWVNKLGFPKERIVRLGANKNYWPANAPKEGPNGVCGPCNEIFLDVTPEKGYPEDPAYSIAYDSNRFVEIWNLVFTQFDRKDGGVLEPLPFKNIDTGMGLERTVAILNGMESNYDTDLFMPIINKVEELSGKKLKANTFDDRCFRVIADHIRSAVFAMCDGVLPSNNGRGYVLRRLIRNAVLKGKKLGLNNNFMTEITPVVVSMMGEIYPELIEKHAYAEKIMAAEEEKFRATLEAGLERFEESITNTKELGLKKLSGDDAFSLYDTFGFPLELTVELAREKDIEVDLDGFNEAMEEQKNRSKAAGNFSDVMGKSVEECFKALESKNVPKTVFVGYDNLFAVSKVLGIINDGALLNSATSGDKVQIIVENTPFYAEMGGQVGDVGTLKNGDFKACVLDTTKQLGYYLHSVEIKSGNVNVGDEISLKVDADIRMDIQRNHSATHVLHHALQSVLGEHAVQSGSYVNANRLRFDYNHFQSPTDAELKKIESIVNDVIFSDLPVTTIETDINKARELGAKALFGEKYGDVVRVVNMECSKEFCGGTHVDKTSQIGVLKIVSESSVGAGLRRIEAITGRNIVKYINNLDSEIKEITDIVNAQKGDAVNGVKRLAENYVSSQKEVENLRNKVIMGQVDDIITRSSLVNDIRYIGSIIETADIDIIKKFADVAIDRIGSGVVFISGHKDEKVVFVCKATKDVVAKGAHCGNMVKAAAKVAGGGGGGRPDFAQAGGKNPDAILEAMATARALFEEQTKAK